MSGSGSTADRHARLCGGDGEEARARARAQNHEGVAPPKSCKCRDSVEKRQRVAQAIAA